MAQFRFLDWKVYKDAQTLYFEVRKITKELPQSHRFDIGTQILRSSLSIVLNIAEGSGKSSRKDVAHFMDIALGSLYETRAAIDTLESDTDIKAIHREDLVELMGSIGRQLGGLRKNLKG